MRPLALLVVAIVAAGCDPELGQCMVLCDDNGGCPSGYTCNAADRTCHASSANAICSATSDAAASGADDAGDAGDQGNATDAASGPVTIRVSALIDGRSALTFRGDSAQWFHAQWVAPGRPGGANVPTTINGVDWLPAWPDVPTPENLHCNCRSDAFAGVTPALPMRPMEVSLTAIEARGTAKLIETPTAENSYATTVELDDVASLGAAVYVFELQLVDPAANSL